MTTSYYFKWYFKLSCYKYVPTFCVSVSSAHATGGLFTVSAPGPLNIPRPPLLLHCKQFKAETRSAARSPTLRVAPCCLHMFVTEYATVWPGDAAAFSFTLRVFLSPLVYLLHFCCALTGLDSTPLDGTFSPRQWKLEGLAEVKEAPADNNVVVEAHKAANLKGRTWEKTAMVTSPESKRTSLCLASWQCCWRQL